MKKLISSALTLLSFVVLLTTSGCSSKKEISEAKKFLGVWEIYRFVSVHKHDSKSGQLAKDSIGKKVEFGKNFVKCPDDVFFLLRGLYENVSYSIKTKKYNMVNGKMENDDYDFCTLGWYGLPDAPFEDKTIYFIFKTKMGENELEITKNGELTTCAEDVFVFLKKVK